ncbi:MAG: hypothetical protein AVDCRST_MAG89-2756, partial [uncultured Gemmatimonadetes bacterium]
AGRAGAGAGGRRGAAAVGASGRAGGARRRGARGRIQLRGFLCRRCAGRAGA